MIDTNTVSYIVNGRSPSARERLEDLGFDEVACISAITEAELRYGIAKKSNARALSQAIENFLPKVDLLPWGKAEAAVYGRLRAQSEAIGRPLATLDMMIASHAIAVGAILVTRDKALGQLPQFLATENWATDI